MTTESLHPGERLSNQTPGFVSLRFLFQMTEGKFLTDSRQLRSVPGHVTVHWTAWGAAGDFNRDGGVNEPLY